MKTEMSQQNLVDLSVVLYIKRSVIYFKSCHNSGDEWYCVSVLTDKVYWRLFINVIEI